MMKILHVAPLSPYNIGWSYQDNLLPKYQRKLGHEVKVVVSTFENTPNGKKDVGEQDFLLDDGVHVYRRKRFLGNNFLGKLISFTDISDILDGYEPDFIMIHSLITLSVFQAIKYKKKRNPNCVIIHDNHLDENIGKRKNWLFSELYYGYWALVNQFSKKYISKYCGVTPWRREFIVNRFKIDREKTDVLIMGADIDNIDFSKAEQLREKLDDQYGLRDQFVIVTGGKIEKNKKIAILMRAVAGLKDIKLLVFGTVADDYQDEVNKSLNDNVIMLGWKNNDAINRLFTAADLAIFPGQHSVLWEQACACKIPCIFAYWDGMDHLDNGGNSEFIRDLSEKGLRQCIVDHHNTDKYKLMKAVAKSKATDTYSYYEIAKKSLETAQQQEVKG